MKKFISTIIFMMSISAVFSCRQTDELEDMKPVANVNAIIPLNKSGKLTSTKKSSDTIVIVKSLATEASAGDPPGKDPFRW